MACSEKNAEVMHKYLDEEITLLEKKKFESHLVECEACEQHLRELRKTVAIIQSASHIEAPKDFTANVMGNLPKQSNNQKWKTWIRKHPYIITAAVFFLVFIISLNSIWTDGGKEIVVKGDGHFIVDEERRVVVIPEGHTISGDLIVRNGNIEVEGEVLGNITVINGEQYLASAGQVTGEIKEINMIFEWLWYHTKSFFSDVINLFGNANNK
ncbi:zf-HC2 domain-containing protein [Evansella sp. AB-P1]|uniref:zf-HC2 domain-containing protein n=1 Tax=Evansella sp. AB-P1 TaxID=3037653 RepID=UPI00241CC4C6|nr:zf-HC2 domain-containing protein [Evansella sp. AB-P1]MDG5788069.1 zf-HC2 domain-containing protein [Evansella sp. AB-P1]